MVIFEGPELETLEALRKLAARERRTVEAQIMRLIDRAVELYL